MYDVELEKVGEYREKVGPYLLLRPIGGGREWEVAPADVRPATPAEYLSAKVRAANDQATHNRAEPMYGPPGETYRPPVLVPDCTECAELGAQRAAARAEFDWSKETDANVLLRSHQRRDHGA
ncbi:hypothetical protein [Streptomyces graminilatus]|uniref:hypothetical protein n=1 Tax=Streptomyces graminilatus TaxID=1464070 RepID=UPI0006E451B5|nr:hypothetical protein [Streptomyces graminilatus]